MAHEELENKSLPAKAVWPLLVLTATLQVHFGLSAVAYPFMGRPNASGLGGWTAATMSGLQAVAAVVAFMLAARRDLRGTTLAVAGSIMLGRLSTRPSVFEPGLDFYATANWLRSTSPHRPSSQSLRPRLRGATSILSRPPSS